MNLNTKVFKYPCRPGALLSMIMKRTVVCVIILIYLQVPASAQTKYKQPSWWFGVAGAANFNFYGAARSPIDTMIDILNLC